MKGLSVEELRSPPFWTGLSYGSVVQRNRKCKRQHYYKLYDDFRVTRFLGAACFTHFKHFASNDWFGSSLRLDKGRQSFNPDFTSELKFPRYYEIGDLTAYTTRSLDRLARPRYDIQSEP